jgi:hypothetical protein
MHEVFLTKEAAKYYSKCDLTTKRWLDKCFKDLEREPVYLANVKLRPEDNSIAFFASRMSFFLYIS